MRQKTSCSPSRARSSSLPAHHHLHINLFRQISPRCELRSLLETTTFTAKPSVRSRSAAGQVHTYRKSLSTTHLESMPRDLVPLRYDSEAIRCFRSIFNPRLSTYSNVANSPA